MIKFIIALYTKLTEFISRRLNHIQFLLFLSVLVGIIAGFASVVLKLLVHYFHTIFTHDYQINNQWYYVIAFPTIGLIVTVIIVKIFFKGKFFKGVSSVLYDIAQKSSSMEKHKTYSHVITSSITVGLGGSAGLEAPIAVTGSAIGSNFGIFHKLNYKDRTLLLGCGAAAGISAAFNAPITGVIFALEVILADISISAFIPLIISSASGAIISKILLNESILLHFRLHQTFNFTNVPFYILLGILSGFASLYYAKTFLSTEKFLSKYQKPFTKAIIGGLILAILYFFVPTLFGEGYDSIKVLANEDMNGIFKNSIFYNFRDDAWFSLIFIGVIAFVKVIATSITLSSGGNGGNFAPSLFVGGYLGFFFAKLVNQLGIAKLPVSNFTIVGMGGVLAGVMYAPLTGIFLIAEITGGYDLFIPLMIVSALTFAIVKRFERYSMDTRRLAMMGKIFTEDKDKNILTSIRVSDVVETNVELIAPNAKLLELIKVLEKSKSNVVAVTDERNILLGIIETEDIRNIMFKQDVYDYVEIKHLMKRPPAFIYVDENMDAAVKKFDKTQSWNLPVIRKETKEFIGFISKSTIFSKYRELLKSQNMQI
ncbi:MAG: chloride channel protein [Bacteroidales bacterium]|nr:chloride channel protein [Bacteroidales bacterium]